MTSVRQGFLFCIEKEFKKGKTDENIWIAPPPGSYFSNTSARGTTTIRGTGNKNWEVAASGAFGGSWDWTFMLDYDYLEPLALAFDQLNEKSWPDTDFGKGTAEADGGKYTYKFSKGNNTRIPSFCVRRKILNRIAGGPENSDELTELYGCVVQSVSFARSASTSQIQVTMSGVYSDEKMVLGQLDSTDYQPYNGHLMEYSCMLVADNAGTFDNAKYVANTDSLSISIQNNAGVTNNLCNAFPESYFEGFTQYQLNTSVYSNNPEVYKTRVYAGGQQYPADKTSAIYPKTFRPVTKKLVPLSRMYIATYDFSVDRSNATNYTSDVIVNAYKSAERSTLFTIEDAVLKSMKWQNGEGSKLVDALSSVECKSISILVKTERASIFKDGVTSPEVGSNSPTT